MNWELVPHSYQIADTGDYDGHYEITNGSISLSTSNDDEEALQSIVDALNNSGCEFYVDNSYEFEVKYLREENARLSKMLESIGKILSNEFNEFNENDLPF